MGGYAEETNRGNSETFRPKVGDRSTNGNKEPNLIRKFTKIVSPGFITGASDDDPSGIGTYATAGATLGFSTLWTALLTFPLMAALQFICANSRDQRHTRSAAFFDYHAHRERQENYGNAR